MKYIVYLTVNRVNGKIYVGVHKTNDPWKFDGYIGCGVKFKSLDKKHPDPQTAFQKAFNKYGAKNFTRHTLMVFDNDVDAYKAEEQIVTLNFVKSSKTYNVNLGGGSGAGLSSMKPTHKFTLSGEYVDSFSSIVDAADSINGVPSNISRCLLGKTASAYGFRWSFDKDPVFDSKHLITEVHQYNLDGRYVTSHPSLKKAADSISSKALGSTICNCAQGNRKKAYGYIWNYNKVDTVEPVRENYKVIVHRYSLEGVYIDSHPSIKEASIYLGKSIGGNIASCTKGTRKTAGGFRWSLTKQDKL